MTETTPKNIEMRARVEMRGPIAYRVHAVRKSRAKRAGAVRIVAALPWCLLVTLTISGSTSLTQSRHHFRDHAAASSDDQGDSFQTGLTALKENRLEDALAALSAAEQEHGDDARIHNFRGIVLGRLGRNSDAAEEYGRAIRIDPQFADALRNLGFLYWTEHRLEPAKNALVRAVEISPDDAFAHYYLGRVHLDGGQYADAVQELKRSQVPWPNDPEFLLQGATAYAGLQQNAEASRTLEQLEPLTLDDSQSVRAAQLLLAIRENKRAIEILKKSAGTQGSGKRLRAQFDLGLVFLLSGNYEQAAESAKLCLKSPQQTPAAPLDLAAMWSLLGVANARRGDGDASIEAFRRAANLDPNNEELWLNLTRELMELSRYADAIAATQQGISADGNSYALHLRLGAAFLAAGRYAESENIFRTLVTAGDPLPTSYVGLAQVLLREGRPEEAASEVAAAQKKIGASFLLSYFAGLSWERAGKRQEAMAAYREAVQLNPTSAEAHLGLGKLLMAPGRGDDGIMELEEALRLSPGNVQARRLLSQAYRRAGNKERAEKYSEALEKESPAPEGDLLGDFLLPKWQMP